MLGLDTDDVVTVLDTLGRKQTEQAVRQVFRRGAVEVFQHHSADDLRDLIDNDYPLAERDLPEPAEEALRAFGPEYEDLIDPLLTPESVLDWLWNPDWVDDQQTRDELRACAHVIRSHSDGERWFRAQVDYIRNLALDQPVDDAEATAD